MLKSIFYKLYAKRFLIALLLVLFFHLVGNFVWITLNQSPPSWDEANHIRRSVQYTYFMQDFFAGRLNWGMAWDSFQDGYGPLVRIITGIFMLFAGVGVKQTQIVSTLFFLATIVAVYLLANEMAQLSHAGESETNDSISPKDSIARRLGALQNDIRGVIARNEVTKQSHIPSDPRVRKNDIVNMIAFGTATVFSFYQLVYAHSRWLLLDIPVTLFTTLSFLFLIKSGWGCKRKETILAGVLAACAMLTKAQAVVYFVIPALYVIWEILFVQRQTNDFRVSHCDSARSALAQARQAGERSDEAISRRFANWIPFFNGMTMKQVTNMLIAGIICLILFSLWAIPNFSHMYEYVKAGSTIKLDHPDNLFSITTWLFYAKIIINNIMTVWGFLICIPGVLMWIRNRTQHHTYILLTIFGMYVGLTLISNKDLRFMYPVLPYIAFICVSGWAQIIRRLVFSKQAITLGIVFALVLLYFVFEMSLYMTLSFGFPLPQIERKVLELPNIGDITILDTSSTYPVKRVSYDKWPVEQIAHDMYSYAEDQGNLTFFFLPNLEYFNDNNVALELTRHRAVNVSLQRGLEKKNFDTEGELLDYVNKYTQFIYLEGPFSPDFLWNKKLFEQIQSEIQKRRINEELQTVKTYHLPNKQTVYWLKKVK